MAKQRSGSKQFGIIVRAAREEAGLSGDQLAKKIGMGHRFMWALERGECSIQPSRLDALCKALPRLEAHRDLAPKPARLATSEQTPKVKANGAPVIVDSTIEFFRAIKRVGIEKAFELVKLFEVLRDEV
jgi:transcriptional regulator with XRE-family HTH domain